MKAVVCTDGRLYESEVASLSPARGQVLLNVIRAGICGSDLHARQHADSAAELAAEAGYPDFMRSTDQVVFGHEFVGTVASYGPGTKRRWPVGTRVVSLPTVMVANEPQLVGLSERAPGAYAEQVLVQEAMTMPVPDRLTDDEAALTEPMAVALHAVRRAQVGRRQPAIVIGCGPIGLAVIAMLRAAGVRKIIASDFSPRRRELATQMGAHVVVDPRTQQPWDAYKPGRNELRSVSDLLRLGVDSMKKLRMVPGPLPWWYAFGIAEKVGEVPIGPVVFECVGVRGMIEQIITAAPFRSRVVVVGVTMEPDTFRPAMAGNKEIDLRFVFGYDPGEFHQTLALMASGKVNVGPMVTGTVGLADVADAFDALRDPEQHAKILIDPSRGSAGA